MGTPFSGSFQVFAQHGSQARFTDWLAAKAEPSWSQATGHPFTNAIGDGTMPGEAYVRYLIEDYTFVKDLASTIGYLVAKAPSMRSKAKLSSFLAMLTSEENDYFIRSFDALDVPQQTYEAAAQGPVTQAFAKLLLSASGEGSYAEGLTCLLCAEWCYLTWGQREAQKPRPEQFYLAEWIDLHAVPGFEAFVGWIREDIDDIGPTLTEAEQERLADLFRQMSQLEAAFFEAAWSGKTPELPGVA